MNYLNIHTDTLKSEEFIGAEPIERATWIALLGWCASQENGGVIWDCHLWGDRKWMSLCGVTSEEVKIASKLYRFEEGNLVVTFYPIDAEELVKSKREAGKKGGRPKKANAPKPLETKEENHMVNHPENHMVKQNGTMSETKGKEMEGNEKKRKVIAETQAIAWSSSDGWTGITQNDYDEWRKAYPACDVTQQLARMTEWLKSNPSKAHKKLWRKFLTSWLSRSQERGGDIPSNRPQAKRIL